MAKTQEEILEDIIEHPENHKHDFRGLIACCMVKGVFVASLMEAHSKNEPFGRNGGVVCDVSSGPCACGGWH